MPLTPQPGPLGTGPESPPHDADLAPLVSIDDLELEDLLWRRGRDCLSERDYQQYEAGHRDRDFFR